MDPYVKENESQLIEQLRNMLPMSPSVQLQQAKKNVIRLTKVAIMINEVYGKTVLPYTIPDGVEIGELMIQAMDYFCMHLLPNGTVLYVSQAVATHIGVSQYHMIGSNLAEFVHPKHFLELIQVFQLDRIRTIYDPEVIESCFPMVLKFPCNMCKKVSKLTHNGFKVLKVMWTFQWKARHLGEKYEPLAAFGQFEMIEAFGYPDMPLRYDQCFIKTRPDLSIFYIDKNVVLNLGYLANNLVNTTLYTYIHVDDVTILSHHHRKLATDPEEYQVALPMVRLLRINGGHLEAMIHMIKMPTTATCELAFAIQVLITVTGFVNYPIESTLQQGLDNLQL